MILLIASKTDTASMNIANQLLKHNGFRENSDLSIGYLTYSKRLENGEIAELVFIEEEPVRAQFLHFPLTLGLLIFLSRHASQTKTPTLSVHTPGNFGDANLGGLTRMISVSPASAMKEALKAMKKAQEEKDLRYEVSYECTHHGPSLDVPTMFVELGSSIEQWTDYEAAEAVMRGAIAAMSNRKSYPAVLGIGGPHYNRKFTDLALSTEIAFGHIVPKYAVHQIDGSILRQCIEKTVEPVGRVLLDWKGIKGSDKETLLCLLDKTDLEIEKI